MKRAFQDRESWDAITKKPTAATDEESGANPRARSAKLRAALRVEDGGVSMSGMRSKVKAK